VYSIPSAVIYFVAQPHNLNISKRDIREKGGVSEVTINKIYKKILLIKKGVVLIDN
jgi:transcription initiation factor TFIIIB Brf1 subunit/transcription initiation factor TFIIB